MWSIDTLIASIHVWVWVMQAADKLGKPTPPAPRPPT